MYRIEKYTTSYYNQWNELVQKSKNGTFLFHRDFMEYHSDRFTDYSLMVFKDKDLVAILPANIVNNSIHSHQGLTYGGLIYTAKLRINAVLEIINCLLIYLHTNGIFKLYIKTVPPIYHMLPSQETEYALFRANAKLYRRDTMFVIDNSCKINIAANRMEGIKKGRLNSVLINEEKDFSEFWNVILEPNLRQKFGTVPVHSLEEITKLAALFPENIKLFTVRDKDGITAGTVLFETPTTVHTQYISADNGKSKTGCLDYLFYTLITEVYAGKKYFDFGTSNGQKGNELNEGLAFWKESFGARTIVHDFYEVDTINAVQAQ